MNENSVKSKLLGLCSAAVMTAAAYGTLGVMTEPTAFAATSATSTGSVTSLQQAVASAKVKQQSAIHWVSEKRQAEQQARIHLQVVERVLQKAKASLHVHSTSATAKQAVAKSTLAVTKARRSLQAAQSALRLAIQEQKAAVAQTKAAESQLAAAEVAAKSTKTTQKYKDGTYTGVGETPIGAVQVQLTLKSDKITDVKITGYSTHYPIGYIDPILPQELLQRQDVNQIDVVSGATLSTEDFYYAVMDCLQQAQNK